MNSIKARFTKLGEERQAYTLQLPSHLASAGQEKKLRTLLWMFEFLHIKLAFFNSNDMIADLNLLHDKDLQLVRAAIRMSAHIIDLDSNQLAAQIVIYCQRS